MTARTDKVAAETALCFLMWLGLLSAAQAQGNLVYFGNSSGALSSPPDRLVRFDPTSVGTDPQHNPYGTNGAPVVDFNSSYRAQLYYGSSTATEGSLIPVSTTPAIFRPSTTDSPGTWGAGMRRLDGFSVGDTVSLQVRVWDATYASSWEEYLTVQQGLAGKSAIFSYSICSSLCTPPDTYNMLNFTGFFIGVPEPGTVPLLWFGFALLFARSRLTRKAHSTER